MAQYQDRQHDQYQQSTGSVCVLALAFALALVLAVALEG